MDKLDEKQIEKIEREIFDENGRGGWTFQGERNGIEYYRRKTEESIEIYYKGKRNKPGKLLNFFSMPI